MRLNNGVQNLHQFLTNNRANSQKSNIKNNKIYNNTKIYNQSKSNINIINAENSNKRFNLFSNLNVKQKEKINLSKFLKGEKNYYNNINLVTEQNFDKKHEPNKLNLNLSFLSNKNGKGNSFKTLNYDRSSYVRIMKYFTIKSSNKPMEFEDLSPVLIPIRNTLSNEHRNTNLNINPDNVKDKINFYYYINSKEKVIQLFKDNKKKKRYKYTNNKSKDGETNKDNIKNNSHRNNEVNNINLINNEEKRNNNLKGSDNNLTFSKNSNESEFTFKDKGSVVFNMDNKKSNNKDNSNDSSHNNLLNSELNSFHEKENKKTSNKQSLNKNSGKNCSNRVSISVEKINNKEEGINLNDIYSKNNYKNINEEKKANNSESPKFLNEKLFKKNQEKPSSLLGKILNNQIINKNIKVENDINSNNKDSMHTIENNENNDNKNNLKNSYQFRIRKINLPSGLNFASIQHNNKLLQNLINKKSKKNKVVLNNNKIQVTQAEYKMMKGEKIVDENRNLYNIKKNKK